MNSITSDMKYRQSMLTYAQKYGTRRASGSTTKAGLTSTSGVPATTASLQSPARQSRRPHSPQTAHPGQT